MLVVLLIKQSFSKGRPKSGLFYCLKFGDAMKWFSKLPPEIRHLLSSILTALIVGQAVKHGYVTPDQAIRLQPQINAAQEK